jgi:hypothetical protein
MADAQSNPPALKGTRLWIAVGAVAVLVLALAGGGYWWMTSKQKAAQAAAAAHPHLLGDIGSLVTALDTTAPSPDKICATTLARALDFGVLPPGATLASQEAKAGQPEGRFTCEAQGTDGKYTMIVDTACPGSQEKTCYALDSVRRDNGTFVYKRGS